MTPLYTFLGSLSDYLRVHELSTRELFNIISTMAKGLAFLHSDKNIYDPHRINKPAIAHRDFKSKNVLLKQDSNGLLSAVISDFGLGTVQKLTNLFMIHTLCLELFTSYPCNVFLTKVQRQIWPWKSRDQINPNGAFWS